MGLLDNLTDDPTMSFAMGLLNASGPSARPVSLGQGIAQGYGAMSEARQNQLKNKQAQQAMLLQQMQMDQLKKQIATKELLGKALMGDPMQQTPQPYGGGYSPDVAKAFGVPAGNEGMPQMQPQSQASYADQLLAAARKAGDADLFQEAMKMKLEEKKLAPKFATDVRIVMKNGVPTAVQMADDGTVKEMSGFAPAEKLHFADNGQFTGIGIDQYTGKPVTQGLKKQMSDAEKASNALGWANYNKPSIQNVEGVGLMQVGPKGNATPVMLNGSPVVQDKPLTEVQGKAAGFADRMIKARAILSDPKVAVADKPEVTAEILKAIPSMGIGTAAGNKVESSARQQYRQAQEDWVRAKLRKESGAVIGAEEMQSEIDNYFPKIGDSKEVREQKAQARLTAEQGIVREAGKSYQPPQIDTEKPSNRGSTGKIGAPASKQVTLDDGTKVLAQKGNDGNYYVMKGGKKYMVQE